MPFNFQPNSLYNYGGISPNNLVSYITTYNPLYYNNTGGYFGTGTTVFDLSPNKNNFTLVNPYAYSGGITFPGNNTYLISGNLINYFSSFNGQTQEVWFKNSFYSSTGNGVIMSELGQSTINFLWHDSQIEIVGSTGYIGVWNSGIQKTPVGSFNDGTWNCITWRYDGTGLSGFVNGTGTTRITTARTTANPGFYVALGAIDGTSLGDGNYYKGQIGSYKLYNRAITNSEILQNYNYEKQFFRRTVRVNVVAPGENATWYSDIISKITSAKNSLYSSIQLTITQTNIASYTGNDLNTSTYDTVFIFTDPSFNNSTLGTNLNNFISSGGGLVICTFAIASVSISGFTYTNCPVLFPGNQVMSSTSLGSYTASDPLMNGVTSFNPGSSRYGAGSLTLQPGATTVASYNDGNILVAKKTIGSARTVALNFFPPSSTVRADFWSASTNGDRLMTNAIMWSGKGI